ncbi:MAG: putative HNHc nuclease [Lachnospiraceae bacterium]|nr:putative HNHc nuclease [Lachnospiraceae bacterium]
MNSPIDTAKGRITGYDEKTQELLIRVPYTNYQNLIRREYKTVTVQLNDSRLLSDKQRKSCYAMIGEIADWMGEEKYEVKQLMKIEFMTSELQQTADVLFSLSDSPMSLICAFQGFIARFIVRNDIPTKRPMLDYVDDVGDYVYACLANKKCCICGRMADIHHSPALGKGIDRTKINHIGMTAEPLCREHHQECHRIGQKSFDRKYHIEPVKIDKVIAKAYGLNTRSKKGENKSEQGDFMRTVNT